MASFSIEDIELLRRRSGITYEEAVNLLEYHNGSVARSLVDLEKNGRLKKEYTTRGAASGGEKGGIKGLFAFLYALRIKAARGTVPVLNVSALAVILTLLTAPHVVVVGLIAMLILGYKLSVEKDSPDFVGDSFDDLVRKAKTNVHNTVDSISRSFSGKEEEKKQENTHGGAASGTTPVNVQFPGGGGVNVREDQDGFHEADIH
ncbi:MAG: hypothetical protein E7331_04470 [Clostridiales bacterium]|nr:hypothetical protein [Clostridiales bacterium]